MPSRFPAKPNQFHRKRHLFAKGSPVRKAVERMRDEMCIRDRLGCEVERPGGTFYIFPKALEEDANAFCMKAREFDLFLVPSDTFGVKGYVRFAYCIDTEKVKRSLPALEKLAAAYRK